MNRVAHSPAGNTALSLQSRGCCSVLLGLLLLLLCAAPVRAQAPLADARALIAAQQASLGSAPGTVLLDRPARLEGELTLQPGHGLRITAPLTVAHATVHLAGHNQVLCQAEIHVQDATDLFVADGATDISVRGCDVTVTGQPGGYLLTATRSVRVVETDNHLVGMAIFNTHNEGGPKSQTTDVSILGNSTEMRGKAKPIGVYLMYVQRGVVSNNRFMGTGHGIEWWGGDGNQGWHGAENVTLAGNLSITGNECFDPGGACVWGSMGVNVSVTGNTAQNCGDVCFDTEGGVHNLFSGNVARQCYAGCYSVQMESVDAVFTGNFAYADTQMPTVALVLIKHHNGNPAGHVNLTITGNTLSCGTRCVAVYTEGESGLDLSHNTVINGTFEFVNYTSSVVIQANNLHFTVPLTGKPAIMGPALAGGHTSVIRDNTLLEEADAPGTGNGCIVQAWTDDNNTDEMRIEHNTCIGFNVGVLTETAGHNAGAPRALWTVRDNEFSRIPESQLVLHRKTSGNEVYVSGETVPK